MAEADPALKEIGRRVAELDDAARGESLDLAAGARRFMAVDVAAARRASRARGRAAVFRVSSLLAAAAFGLVLFVVLRPKPPLSFEVGESANAAGKLGAWVASPPSIETPVRFSDGSRLRLGAGGQLRVLAVESDGAEIALERGTLDLAVIHRAATHWRVRVGPFVIHVVGTRFATSWSPETQRFSVALHEGAIVVDGPLVGDARPVRAGDRITVSLGDRSIVVDPVDDDRADHAEAPAASTPAIANDRAEVDDAPAPVASTSANAASPSVASPRVASSAAADARPPSWRELAGDNHYPEALAAAEREGFDAIARSGSAADVHALADVARLAGSPARANEALHALLDRFPGSVEASYAVFMFGRAAQDQQHDYAGASIWFSRYLREQPGGRFAEDASGRLVEIADKMKDESRVRQAAERYLARYPSGSHAEYARAVLARTAP